MIKIDKNNLLLYSGAVFILILLGAFALILSKNSQYNLTNKANWDPIETVEQKPEPVELIFTGDIMLGRNVENYMKRQGFDYPFRAIQDFFKQADMVVVNLEGPVPNKHRQTPSGSTTFSFLPEAIQSMSAHGVNIASLANNHTYDYGAAEYKNTKEVLNQYNIQSFGHPRIPDENEIFTTEIKNQKITFVGFNDVFGSLDIAGALSLLQKIPQDEFVIVNIHWGDEYILTSNIRQQNLAHQFIDAGADLVIGHHPHVTQEIEEYNSRLIFYSLGNFIFDQYFSTNTQQGLSIKLTLDRQKHVYDLVPIDLTKSQPKIMSEPAKSSFLKGLAERSDHTLTDQIINAKITLQN